ncbi:hypothetical protein ASG31_09830 [Chryseobacterium sp. Leaf404]|uniref:hypothetical protein n=1 Tax=unclassified Chryseobacterium TaxID=2593645 RepID=UPI0006F95902|nr:MULTISPECIES: hypothetical protein [unclassified Chryseobacterium]KQT17680.1 hypothetical protein ASG31_09830 [Chryseobacterium sp. Leaf404]
MNQRTKHLLNSILFASTSILYFFLAYIGYGKQNPDLTKYAHYENVITDKGIGIHYGRKGRKSNVFYLSLNGLDENLGVYRMSKEYDDLLKKIKIGERVKVYYQKSNNKTENINIDLIQVEKDDQILIGKNEYERKESFLIYIGLIGGLGTLFMAYRFYKYRNIFNSRK